jgi:bifunctional non-homologous end joining protein LigD
MRYRPQLATLVKAAPEGDEWLHEIKYDGYRIGCLIERGRATLVSRNGKDWTDSFPPIAAAARELGVRRAILDGEAAILTADGRTSFQSLQNWFAGGGEGLVYFAFDLLELEGEAGLAGRPLEERKEVLRRLLAGRTGCIRISDHVVGGGARFLGAACARGLEGIVSKRRSDPHRPGRTTGWLKSKCVQRQELVIGGFTDPEGTRAGIGALLVGVREPGDDALRFAGKVGTGFTQASALALREKLDAIETKECPFAARPAGLGGRVHWVRPVLVAEVEFGEWTGDGKVRHASFQGLRADKSAREVVRERPAAAPREKDARPVVEGVSLSNPERVMWSEPRISKLDLARYFAEVARWMVPHVEGRPLTLVRCADGVDGGCEYLRHRRSWGPAPLARVKIQEKTKVGEYLVANDAAALVALAQMDVVEVHTWNTRVGAIEKPDRIVIDLDPGPELGWKEVVAGARLVRKALGALDLESWVKTTGGAGLHVAVPIRPERDWSECLAFARGLARALARQRPDLFTDRVARAGREARIYIDYLRNNRGNTSVAALSPRARPGAPVSMPLRWEELRSRARSLPYSVTSGPRHLARRRADPWAEYHRSRQRLGRAQIEAAAKLAR